MDNTLIVLQLVLKELGIDPHDASFENRRRVQKAIYLAQAAGVPLGYTFGWYKTRQTST